MDNINLTPEEEILLEKSFGGLMAAGALMASHLNPYASEAAPAPTQQNPTEILQSKLAASFPQWSPDGLDANLIPIAHLESSFGQNMKHAPSSKGDFDTAYGAVGFKPNTAHEQYLKTPDLKTKYPGLEDPATFTNKFKSDPKFYNHVASAHFNTLLKRHGNVERAAYAWRHGTGAASAASDEQVIKEPYVSRYRDLSASTGTKPSVPLAKMAIKDIQTGVGLGGTDFDYSHVLPKKHRDNYQLIVSDLPNKIHTAKLIDKSNNSQVGQVEVGRDRQSVEFKNSVVHPKHRGKGLGSAAYEALLAHLYRNHGVKYAQGDVHSTSAHFTHQKIADKHGLEYAAEALRVPKEMANKPNNEAFGPYEYAIKSEDQNAVDSLQRLLELDEPMERKMALKSRAITPYHLRLALQDEDPEIRELAVMHPGMTTELLHEILNGDDDHLKETALKREDLREEELKLLAHDPKYSYYVTQHVGCTPALLSDMASNPDVPEGALNKSELIKNIGYITFPNFGEGRVYSEPHIVDSYQAGNRHKYLNVPGHSQAGLTTFSYSKTKPSKSNLFSSYVKPQAGQYDQTTHARLGVDTKDLTTALAAKKVVSGKSLRANIGHETQHGVFARLAQKYGMQAKTRILTTALAKLKEREPDQYHHISKLFAGRPQGTAAYTLDKQPEEWVTHLHNYLTDPIHRRGVHKNLGINDLNSQRESQSMARKAFQNLQKIGSSLTPQEVGVQMIKFEEQIDEWLKT